MRYAADSSHWLIHAGISHPASDSVDGICLYEMKSGQSHSHVPERHVPELANVLFGIGVPVCPAPGTLV